MPRTVLIPLDGSELAERALPYAAELSRSARGRLVLLRVLLPEAPRGQPLVQEPAARAYLEALAVPLQAEGLEAVVEVTLRQKNGVADAIMASAQRHDAAVVVLSSHGRGGLGRWLYGSVADQVLRRASIPVLIVPARREQPWQTGRPLKILVALDRSRLAEEVLGPVRTLSRELGAEVTLLNVFNPLIDMGHVVAQSQEERLAYVQAERERYLKETAEHLEGVDVQILVATQRRNEQVDECIARLAKERESDLVVMVSRRVTSPTSVLLGSVAQGLLQHSPHPVLIVRPGAAVPGEAAVGASGGPVGGQ